MSIASKGGWPEAKFLSKPNTAAILEFLKNYRALFGTPKRIRTYPRSPFRSDKFRQFCQESFIVHIECPIREHRGNGKIERCIRTLTERLRTYKRILLEKDNTGLSENLSALRTAKSKPVSPAEQQLGRNHNTVGDLLKPSFASISEKDAKFQLALDELPHNADSTILIRQRVRGSELEYAFRKQRGQTVKERTHTLSLLPSGTTALHLLSTRDVACVPAAQNATRSTQDEVTNRNAVKQREVARNNGPIKVLQSRSTRRKRSRRSFLWRPLTNKRQNSSRLTLPTMTRRYQFKLLIQCPWRMNRKPPTGKQETFLPKKTKRSSHKNQWPPLTVKPLGSSPRVNLWSDASQTDDETRRTNMERAFWLQQADDQTKVKQEFFVETAQFRKPK